MASAVTLLEAVNALVTLTTTATQFMTQAQQISQIVAKAQQEGRTQLTPDEWKVVTDSDTAARNALVEAIIAAKGKAV